MDAIPTIRPLHPAVGAEVSGVDLARLDDVQLAVIRDAWQRHSALLFRDQRLSDDDLVAFSRHFGELDPPPVNENGRTFVAGQPDIRRLRIKHDGTYNSGGYLRKGLADTDDPVHSVGTPHPVVCAHPVTGRPVLYLRRRRNAYVMGLGLAESEALLDALWRHATRPDHCLQHRWRVGDLLMWDNRSTMHRRDPFDPAARRIMHRTQIRGRSAPRAFEGVPVAA